MSMIGDAVRIRLSCLLLPCCLWIGLACLPSSSLGQKQSFYHNPNDRNFDPRAEPTLFVADATVQVSARPAPFPFVLKIHQIVGAIRDRVIILPYEMAQVDEISLWKDRIVVRGMVNNAAGIVVILEKASGRKVDEFYGYWPSFSPAGFILFTKMYPTHFADGTEDHYLVYKLDRSPDENRPPQIPQRSRPEGIPLYPLSAGNEDSDNVNLPGSLHLQASAGFFWNDRGNEALTLDSLGGEYNLILMQFGAEEALVKTLAVTPGTFCPAKLKDECPELLYLSHARFETDSNGNEFVKVVFGRPQDARMFEKSFLVSEFTVVGTRSLVHPRWSSAQ